MCCCAILIGEPWSIIVWRISLWLETSRRIPLPRILCRRIGVSEFIPRWPWMQVSLKSSGLFSSNLWKIVHPNHSFLSPFADNYPEDHAQAQEWNLCTVGSLSSLKKKQCWAPIERALYPYPYYFIAIPINHYYYYYTISPSVMRLIFSTFINSFF